MMHEFQFPGARDARTLGSEPRPWSAGGSAGGGNLRSYGSFSSLGSAAKQQHVSAVVAPPPARTKTKASDDSSFLDS